MSVKEGMGELIDPDFLKPETKRRLCEIWRSAGHPTEHEEALIESANLWAIEYLKDSQGIPTPAHHKEDLSDIARQAKKLRQALERLSLNAVDHINGTADLSPLGVQSDYEHFARDAHRWIQALERVAEYSAEKVTPDKNFQHTRSQVKGFCIRMAEFCCRATGKWPPKDRAAWFCELVQVVCRDVGIEPAGWRIIRNAIDEAERLSHRQRFFL